MESQIELHGDSLQLEMRAQELRRELNTLRENKANLITLDREADFKRYGERPTRYFCNLEKYKKNSKTHTCSKRGGPEYHGSM